MNLYAQYPETYRPTPAEPTNDPITRRLATAGLVAVALLIAAVIALTITSSTTADDPTPVRQLSTTPARAPETGPAVAVVQPVTPTPIEGDTP